MMDEIKNETCLNIPTDRLYMQGSARSRSVIDHVISLLAYSRCIHASLCLDNTKSLIFLDVGIVPRLVDQHFFACVSYGRTLLRGLLLLIGSALCHANAHFEFLIDGWPNEPQRTHHGRHSPWQIVRNHSGLVPTHYRCHSHRAENRSRLTHRHHSQRRNSRTHLACPN